MLDLDKLVPKDEELDNADNPALIDRDEQYKDGDCVWLWNGQPINEVPEGHDTFVYMITNKLNGKRYVGVKKFYGKSTRVVNKKKKRIKVESDWRDYFGSSSNVVEDVYKFGKGNFLREIIALTVNQGVGKYYEAKQQILRDAIVDPTYYNGIINLRLNHTSLKKINEIVEATTIIGDSDVYQSLRDRCLKQ